MKEASVSRAGGNGSKAAIAAGYSVKTARAIASHLLTKVNIQAAVRARQAQESTAAIAGANERDTMLTAILRATDEDVHARIKAITELNKVTGRHSLRHEVGGRLRLEQVLANSRADE